MSRGLSRRELGRAAVALSAAVTMRAYGRDRAPPDTWSGYTDAMVIDALSGVAVDLSASVDACLSPSAIHDIEQSGLTAINVTVGVGGNSPTALAGTTDVIVRFEQRVTAHDDLFVKVLTGADLALAKKTKKLGLIYGFQDSWPFGSELFRLETFFH